MTPEEMFEKVGMILGKSVQEVYCTPYVELIHKLVEVIWEDNK